MSVNIVNPDTSDDEHQEQLERDNNELSCLLQQILVELRIIKMHMEKQSDEIIKEEDLTDANQ
jgi:hypothetical protein